jgi:glutathione S-transferase
MLEYQLYYHPLSSFCWKALIALYDADVPFTPVFVDLGDPAERAALVAMWPMGRFPVLRAGDRVFPETSILIEHAAPQLVPSLEVRARDRFFDLDLHLPMQKIVGDRLRPEGQRDPFGVEEARARIRKAYAIVDTLPEPWACGDAFTLADCAAAPALFYADKVEPITQPRVRAYLGRLRERPSFARVLREAEPYFAMFPA